MNAARLLSLIAVMLVSGCAGVFPEKTAARGTPLTLDQVSGVQPGVTTRTEVLAQLGTNCVMCAAQPQFGRPARLAYTWEGGVSWTGWYSDIWICGIRGDRATWGGWHAYFVALDTSDVVIAANFQTLGNDQSLHEQLNDWATTQVSTP